jgi:plastocyanin
MASILQRLLLFGCTFALIGVFLVACGGSDASSSGTAFTAEVVAQQVHVAADPSGALRWDRAEYTATAGDITFIVKNASPVGHQFGIEGNGVNYQSANFGANTNHTFTVKGLPAGEYQIVCNYPGHRSAGMISKLIVK